MSGAKAKRGDDIPLLNLLIHHPHTLGRLKSSDCKRLLSDPVIMDIFDTMVEIYTREGDLMPEEVLGKLEGASASERFRDILLSPPIYPEDALEQAVEELEKRVYSIKLLEAISKARKEGDIERVNELIKLKNQEHEGHCFFEHIPCF